ncbi:MAG TPA: NIPSNAP family protein [Gemmatimonadaceae bacterium]
MTMQRHATAVELRQYALHPGQRETLVELFDHEFVETQEAVGIEVIAQFRDIDRSDVFTWLRGFPDMASRAVSLRAFYDGPVWARHRDAANATMISSDNVWLLRPARPGSGFTIAGGRPPIGARAIPAELVVATIYTLTASAAPTFAEWFEREMTPRLVAAGGRPIASFETEPSVNTYPRLPVREGEHAFVWFARFTDTAAYDRHLETLAADREWTRRVRPATMQRLAAPTETWRLTPTARSRRLG